MSTPVTDFTVQIVNHTTGDVFVLGGGTKKQTKVTFYVGAFGPFTKTFDVGKDSPQEIQAVIAQQVQAVRAINTATY